MAERSPAAWLLGLCALGAFLGLSSTRLSINPFTLSVAAYILCTMAVETRRRSQLHPVPWWVAHVVLLPWAAIVLLPWAYYRYQGSWFVLDASIDPDLPWTWQFNLLALVGMTLGTLAALVRFPPPVPAPRLQRVDWGRCSWIIAVLVGLFFVSFLLESRPLSALWKLTGEVRYYDDVDQATGFGFLDYATTVASGVLLVATAIRRRSGRTPAPAEMFWLLVLCLLAVGTGARGRVYFVFVGWLLLQFQPMITNRLATVGRRLVVAATATLFVAVMAFLAVHIADLRARKAGVPEGSVVSRAVASLDVVSSEELLMMRGATPGILEGRSYRQLPSLAIPRRIAGADKENPAADELMRTLLDEAAGFSAPLWFESVLNWGTTGVFVFGVVLGSASVFLLVKAHEAVAPLAGSVLALGPVWLLVSYLGLSRLTLLQFGLTTGSVVVGAYLVTRLSAVSDAGVAPLAAAVRPGR